MQPSYIDTLKNNTENLWEKCYQHKFVQGLGKGDLPWDSFIFYLIQDYHYLVAYSRVFALAASKSSSIKLLETYTITQHSILYSEMEIHKAFLEKSGVNWNTVVNSTESIWNQAYTNFMMTTALMGDDADIIAALLPCAWTYADFGSRLAKDFESTLQTNPYKDWILGYSSEEYKNSFHWMNLYLNVVYTSFSEEKKEKIQQIFQKSLQFEYNFWEMSYQQKMN